VKVPDSTTGATSTKDTRIRKTAHSFFMSLPFLLPAHTHLC
jgi:hypothetical protein